MKDPSTWVYEVCDCEEPYDVKGHEKDRAVRGFSTYDWWNAHSYMSYVILGMLNKFKTDANGHPMGMTQEEWHETLDTMIAGFEAAEAESPDDMPVSEWKEWYEKREVIRKKGMLLFVEHYPTLWD